MCQVWRVLFVGGWLREVSWPSLQTPATPSFTPCPHPHHHHNLYHHHDHHHNNNTHTGQVSGTTQGRLSQHLLAGQQ